MPAFIRVRLNPVEVVTPGETRSDDWRKRWIEEPCAAFLEAVPLLDLPIRTTVEKGGVVLQVADQTVPFFCSWPDAFEPCQFECNSADPYEFLVPASRLAATYSGGPADIRAY